MDSLAEAAASIPLFFLASLLFFAALLKTSHMHFNCFVSYQILRLHLLFLTTSRFNFFFLLLEPEMEERRKQIAHILFHEERKKKGSIVDTNVKCVIESAKPK